MSKAKLGKWINDHMVLLVGIPLIIGIHYGWAKLQDIPYLVDPAHKRELPIFSMHKSLKKKLSGESNTSEPQENNE